MINHTPMIIQILYLVFLEDLVLGKKLNGEILSRLIQVLRKMNAFLSMDQIAATQRVAEVAYCLLLLET